MSFTKTWNESSPAGSDEANQLDTFIQDSKYALRERLQLEHYALNNGQTSETHKEAGGRHKPGYVGALFKGTTAEINALCVSPYPGDGSLAWSTTDGLLYRYDAATNTYAHANNVVASLGSYGGAPEFTGTTANLAATMAYFHQDVENTWGRSILVSIFWVVNTTSTSTGRGLTFYADAKQTAGGTPYMSQAGMAGWSSSFIQHTASMQLFVPRGHFFKISGVKFAGSWTDTDDTTLQSYITSDCQQFRFTIIKL